MSDVGRMLLSLKGFNIGLLFKLKWSGSQKLLKGMLVMKWGQQVLFQGLNGPSFGW